MGARCCVEAVRRVALNCWKTFDKAKDMCDHFASNPSNTGRTSTGGGEKFLKNPFPCSKEKPPEQREALLGRFLIFYTRLA